MGALHDPGARDLEEWKRYILYHLEKVLSSFPPGADKKYVLVFERLGFSRSNFDREGLRALSSILQDFYPETVEAILFLRVNWLFWILFSIMKKLIDPRTAAKIHCLGSEPKEELLKFYTEDQLWDVWGGKLKFQPDPPTAMKIFHVEIEEEKEPDEKDKKEFESKLENDIKKDMAQKSISDLD